MMFIKKILLSLVAILLVFTLSAQKSLKGTWLVGKDNTKIETYQKGEEWFGKVVATDNPKIEIGTDILMGLKKTEGEWCGKILAVRFNKIMDAKIEPAKDVLFVKVTMGFISKKMKWLRVKED